MKVEEKALDSSSLHVARISQAHRDDSFVDCVRAVLVKLSALALRSLLFVLSFTHIESTRTHKRAHTHAHTLFSTLWLLFFFQVGYSGPLYSVPASGEGPSITTITICTHFIKLISVRDQSAVNASPSWNLFFFIARLTMLPH